ncbi:rhomboid family intramembrane serine protease [Cellvibrio sp. pealriver]|uniref:rhomboid family intramembrane serine protease n=1 Tax=Cellvibrio sp. pealriver TaxID=1622269 RepID=UPI00066FF7D1|nr:rhomboid family intramembrane serine protease [Cellvibrio sp. pealriver]
MIIVPTEKQLDWRNAPIILCTLVLLNVMIYFFYQSGDTKKILESMMSYQEQGFLEQEWPVFEKYLEEQQEQELLQQYRREYQANQVELIVSDILMREEFYAYLQKNARQHFLPDAYDQWAPNRALLHKQMQSISFIANGLRASDLRVFSFITHQFLHGDIMHLLGNMFFLIVCGFAVEAAIGHWRFLLFYLLSGVAAGFAQVASDWQSTTPLVGASGAISGVMAMYLAVFRLKKIEFFYWFFFLVGYFRAPALLILPFYIGKEIYSYYTDTGSNVAFMAHAGGFAAGALLIAFAWLLNRNMFNKEYIENDQGIDPQQQPLAEIYESIEKHRFDRALVLVDELMKERKGNFELAMIRYNLLKITRGEHYHEGIIHLLTVPLLAPEHIRQLDKVWKDNPEVHGLLSEQAAMKLGMQFAALENPQSAEQVFMQLLERGCKNPALVVYAGKLAAAFQRLRDIQKKSHYEALSVQLAQQLAQGV